MANNSKPPEWTGRLSSVIDDLRQMNSSTETDFLAVGQKLMDFLLVARKIRADLGQLVDCISGDVGERACHALSSVLDRTVRMQHQIEEARKTLSGLPRDARQIQKCFSGFDRVVLSFHAVSPLARIETTRLGGSGTALGHLADDVKACTETIRTRVEHALDSASSLGECIRQAIEHVSERDLQQLQDLPALVSSVEKALQAFRLRRQQSNATSVRLTHEFDAFSAAINGLVEALQSHDMTRQQIEHVVESLEQVLGVAPNAAVPSSQEGAVIQLQRHQLEGAAATLKASVERIERGLQQIAARGRAMADQTTSLLGLTEGHSGSFFDQMEGCFHSVLSAVSNSTVLRQETADATAKLQANVAGLQSCVGDIRSISMEIHYLAMNAMIEAAHLGGIGGPLRVIADNMRELREDAQQRSDDTEASLAALHRSVLSMSAEPGAEGIREPTDSVVIADLRGRIDELQKSNVQSLDSSKEIGASVATLAHEVQSALESFQVGPAVAEILGRCCASLEEITIQAEPHEASSHRGLHHLAAQYTMESEREVHQMVLAKVNAEAADPTTPFPPDSPSGSEDTSDNFELF